MDLATNSLCPGLTPFLISAFYAQALCAHFPFVLDLRPLDQWGCQRC